jgi:hypothetical protein
VDRRNRASIVFEAIVVRDLRIRDEATESLTFQGATRRFHARLLGNALEGSGWNVTEVARRLDLARSHVYTLIRAFGPHAHRDPLASGRGRQPFSRRCKISFTMPGFALPPVAFMT